MAEKSFLARITPLRGLAPGGPEAPDQGLPPVEPGEPGEPGEPPEVDEPGRPAHPIALPPLPGIVPPPGRPSHPIYVPFPKPPGTPGRPEHPIYVEGTPEHPIVLPPGTIYPPLPPDFSHLTDKTAILVWILGVGARWFIFDPQAVQLPVRPERPPVHRPQPPNPPEGEAPAPTGRFGNR